MLSFETPPSHRGLFEPAKRPVTIALKATHLLEQYRALPRLRQEDSAMKSAPQWSHLAGSRFTRSARRHRRLHLSPQ